MPLKAVRVPTPFEPPFLAGEAFVEKLFSQVQRKPEDGTIHVGDERYVLMRCESLYAAWFKAMAETFGEETASRFIYNTAREIGRSDAKSFIERQGVEDPIARLAAGPVHFAHAGWAMVEILPDSVPATDDAFFLHYLHPNTFESEVLRSRGETTEDCSCLFSAGYSSGWCTEAFGLKLHGRELRCVSKGDDRCEFIMSPADRLDEHEARVRSTWTNS
ncbi:MAG: XylR N-terminal domain-containing protein [Myxococcota bacterium]